MKLIALMGALFALTAVGLLAWKATLPHETWTFAVMDFRHCLTSGNLSPEGDSTLRRNLLRSSLLGAIPASLPTAGEEWTENESLTLQAETSSERRHWRLDWPPLEPEMPVQFLNRISLYYRAGPSPGWQAGYTAPLGQDGLSRDHAIERALDVMESALQVRISHR